ncbi:cobalt-zinc-cadmium resistance protein CzcA [Bathymodiolus platifrons methanotrophic gill symbiont]|uniref:efflux RND transporter permease subunit n=1 Tax=Bathymodiolus platifrons methanotrophic gill symbiont TaxID=113268 RepID=UPI000B69C3F2|nr:CusA/CzcA family heavy metal efflux RND transporter [Bathymodiolus platifrons methanotrophic gill symbiont]GAW86413.1 cobalt-zinc-cadmium resistance protein CzcA [Bathymodiolus platifrons methanotrophic gill symbiont]GFO75237.1 cobalt-zinc-cadmium resistance protein CzcA [Bathymodiolus platifrons methanotrophic gill symbiont]
MINQIINLSLRSRLLMLVLAVVVIATGYRSYQGLPVDAFPDVSPNLVQIFTITEGLAPEEIEMYVTYPVEAAMTGLPGIEKIRSVSNFGLSVVNVYFEDDVSIYFARQLVGERLQEARNQIPASFGEPSMGPISTGMGLVLFYYLKDDTHKYTLEDLRTMQDWIVKFNLQTVRGVTEVLGIGGFEKQFHVVVQPDALLRYQVTLNELIERVRANNLNVGAQYLEKNNEQFIIRSVGLAKGIPDIENIVVKTVDGRPVYLSELAEIKIGGAIRRGLQTRNGEGEVVAGMAIKLYGTNASTVIERVEQKIQDINRTLPEGVSIVPYYQQKDIVEGAVNTVSSALIQGIILVALVLLVFMGGFRPSLVVALAIPFSVMFAFIAMGLLGMSANLMSLGGLAIAIGMMVDGTIVMVENVDRLLRESNPEESRLHVVGRACREVGKPILFAITIIIIVFLPLFTLEGVEGKTFRPLAYTVALAMLGSLVYALFLAPVLSDVLMRRNSTKDGKPGLDERILNALLKPYRPLVEYFVNNRKIAVALSAGLLLLGMVIFPFLGSEFTPKLQEGTIVVRLTMAPSISINESKRNTLIVERRLLKIPEVIEVTSRIGRGEVGAHADPINSAEMYIILKSKDEWRDPGNQGLIEKEIRKIVADLPGITANLTQPIEMTVDELMEGVRAELAVKLFGDNLAQLKTKADEIAAVIKKVEGAADVQVDQVSGTPQLVITPDRLAIARYGLNLIDVQEVISGAIGGVTAGQVFEGIRRFDILVRFQKQDRDSIEAIRNLLISGPDGIKVPLAQIATIEEIVGPRQITRENNQRFISIQANVIDRDIVSFVEEAQQVIDREIKLPPGYFTTWGGQFRLQQEANKRLAIVIPVTLVIISLLLFSSFGSVKNAALILLNIPLALVGGVIALWLSGQNLSVPASVGFIALFGIALENGMVLMTYLNQLVKDGLPIDEASIKGACLRVRPVLMTAVTTALGLIPLLLATGTGSEVQKPLATVVVGGLVTSTFLTLLVIPALYKWFVSSDK